MVDGRVVDLTSELEMECLWFCFSKLLKNVLNEVNEHWITHRIRKSRHDTVSAGQIRFIISLNYMGSVTSFC